ncbi:hypothetical protein ASG73_07640 [Janibacter sp. Soil728]|uniref:OmpA family protein n=1 Tax=Janibacter sp. Soil728 TaxID=1736393 RepID=UPI0006F7AA58|nr:OmpA family protein [Janibacter sp. Soil728]KRE37532.1 hypothetical protein ASG73_07640 [Janibacter sp. Soil728]
MRRVGAACVAGLVLPFVLVVGASADGVDDLPAISERELAESVRALDLGVSDITPSISDVERTEGATAGTVVLDSDILFGFDQRTLSRAAADKVEDILQDAPDGAQVSVTGYTDDIGTDAYNTTLSSDRAAAVGTVITAARPELTVTTKGRGSADPVEPNRKGGEDNPEGRAQNRRVEISYD